MYRLKCKVQAGESTGKASGTPRAFTLVEMLVAMAITLVMMAAVVTLFANVSNSVRNRRATIEMTGVLRHVRNTLQQDLQGATCPGVTWQRPDSNHGYIELIEGIQSDQNPTAVALDPALSIIPRNNIGADVNGDGKITPQELEAHYKTTNSLIPGGLGDPDDVLMLTVRNEHQPFVGRAPTGVRQGNQAAPFEVDDTTNPNPWGYESIESTLAEVVWFCVENPADGEDPGNFFGEPGIRTIYRRTLLIAPWLNPYSRLDANGQEIPFTHEGDSFKAEPGLLRMLRGGIAVEEAIAAIIAFQDRYDLSARLEWDHNIQRWKIVANTLAELTKRENRFGHFGFKPGSPQRTYPYAFVSTGAGYSGNMGTVAFVSDSEIPEPSDSARASANFVNVGAPLNKIVASYSVRTQNVNNLSRRYNVRPFVYVDEDSANAATAQAVLNEVGEVVRVVHGPVPLWGARRGQDVMMTDVLGFDLRVYDPGAPLYARRLDPTRGDSPLVVLQPSDPGFRGAYSQDLGSTNPSAPPDTYEFMGQGAYVDMGYAYGLPFPNPPIPPFVVPAGKSWTLPWFAIPRGLSDTFGNLLAPGYSVYDTWSFHYENNGVDEDNRDNDNNLFTGADEGVDGFDGIGTYPNPTPLPGGALDVRLGPDDVGEYETVPPYDKPLRGVQVLIRTYEPDSRAIRQVRVNQHFLPE
jgi:prepilin-type N-terminal cleavage/methylation domain-containing protein